MEHVELVAEVREERGTRPARRMRRSGWVPAVLYGKNIESIALKIDVKKLREVLGPTGEGHHLLTLRIAEDGSRPANVPEAVTAVVKEVQRNPLTHEFVNVDFQHVSLTERITVSVPIHLHGTPMGNKEGGILEHYLHEVEIQCQAQHLPDRVDYDISNLNIGDSVHVRDLTAPQGVTIMNGGDEVVVTMTAPRIVEEAPPTPPEGEAAPAEPEVIQRGKKATEEEAEEEE